jgi:nicotinamidase-related amidase
MDRTLARLEPGSTTLLVVDIQEKLLPSIADGAEVAKTAGRLIDAAGVLGVPCLATEQYPAGLGRTVAEIGRRLAEASVFEKTRFSACGQEVLKRLAELERPNVVIAGIETHVCVQQTVLDLLQLGRLPFVCADAVGSRRTMDRDIALLRMRQAGAVVTTAESVIFELLGKAGTDEFKRILPIVK